MNHNYMNAHEKDTNNKKKTTTRKAKKKITVNLTGTRYDIGKRSCHVCYSLIVFMAILFSEHSNILGFLVTMGALLDQELGP